MTYEEVRILFVKYPVASTWPSGDPRKFYFDTGPKGNGNHDNRWLGAPNNGERYVVVPFAEVEAHIEKTGQATTENVYYRLKSTQKETIKLLCSVCKKEVKFDIAGIPAWWIKRATARHTICTACADGPIPAHAEHHGMCITDVPRTEQYQSKKEVI